MAQAQVGQGHSVEGVGLDHGVQGHVLQHNAAAFFQRLIEGVIADHIPGQAGRPGQPVGVGLFAGLPAAPHRGPVGHFQHVGHMAGGGSIQNGNVHAVVNHFQHLADQEARVQHHRFARLQVHLHAVGFAQAAHQLYQPLHVVAGAGDVVPAAQVQPFQAVQVRAELRFQRLYRAFQVVRILLAEGVHMQPIQKGQLGRVKVGQRGAQAAAGRARVIDGVTLLCGVLRIHPQAYLLARRSGPGRVLFHLPGRVEHKVVGHRQQGFKLLLGVGRLEHMHLAAELLPAKAGLIQAAGRGARQILPDERVAPVHGKGLLGQQDLAARSPGHIGQQLQISFQQPLVHHKGRGAQLRAAHQSTRAGSSCTCQGRPQVFRASM